MKGRKTMKMKGNARDEDIHREIGKQIREVRMLRKMTQTTLGAQVGVSFQQIQKYERGDNRISVSSLIRICRALNIHPMEIIGRYLDERDVHAASYTLRMKLAEAQVRLSKIHKLSEKLQVQEDWETTPLHDVHYIDSGARPLSAGDEVP